MSHIALDIGGSLVKLVYFSPSDPSEQGSTDGTHRGGRGCRYRGGARTSVDKRHTGNWAKANPVSPGSR